MTKRFTLLAAGALLMAGSSLAAASSPVVKNAMERKSEMKMKFQQRNSNHAARSLKAPMKAPEVITEAKGDPVYYYQDNDVLMYGQPYENYGNVSSIFFTDENEVYFYDMLPEAGFGTYNVGTLEDGVITMELPQMVYYYDDYGYGYELSLLHLEDSGEYVACEGSAQFVMYEDGDIILELPGDEYGEYVLGLIFSDDKSDAELSYMAMVFTPLEEQPATLPAGIETETYYFNDGLFGHPVQVGFDSEYLYMEGLEFLMPEWTVIKAKLDGDQAIISQDQFVGVYWIYLNYTKCVVETPAGYEFASDDAVCTFDIDRENKIITYADGSPLLCINADKDELFELAIYKTFILKVQDSFTGIPSNPYDLYYFTDTLDIYGYYDFMFMMSNISTEGEVLDNDYLYYKIYIDGEPFEFEENAATGEYWGIGKTEDVPYMFDNGNDFYSMVPYSKEVGIYIDGFETIGVQSFYDYEGVLTESALVTLNLETGEITEEGGSTGVTMIPVSSVVKAEYFNLNGQKISNPEKGIYVVRMTLNDGSTVTRKVIRR